MNFRNSVKVRLKQFITTVMAVVLCFGIAIAYATVYAANDPQPAYAADGWKQSGDRWWYQTGSSYATGWKQIDGKWYYFDNSGWMKTGWLDLTTLAGGNHWTVSRGGWYYFNSSGEMATRWQKIQGKWYWFDPVSGIMQTGWQNIDSKYYYCADSGVLLTGWHEIDGQWELFASSGQWLPGQWMKDGKGWWYRWGDGSYPKSSWQHIDGCDYCFDSSGYMLTGWQRDKKGWRYLDASGKPVRSRWVGNYALDSDGYMVTSAWIGEFGPDGYYVGEDGLWVPSMTYDYVDFGATPASDFVYELGRAYGGNKVVPVNGALIEESKWPKAWLCGPGIYITEYIGTSDKIVLPKKIGGLDVVYANLWVADSGTTIELQEDNSLVTLIYDSSSSIPLIGDKANIKYVNPIISADVSVMWYGGSLY